MSEIAFKCCNQEIKNFEVWFLNDIKGFTARKLFKGKCSVCGDEVVLLVEKRIADGKIYANNITHIEAVKTLYREKKRLVVSYPNIQSDNLYGWVYGVNTQVKNKKGFITKIKQFSSDFKGNKKLVKEYVYS